MQTKLNANDCPNNVKICNTLRLLKQNRIRLPTLIADIEHTINK